MKQTLEVIEYLRCNTECFTILSVAYKNSTKILYEISLKLVLFSWTREQSIDYLLQYTAVTRSMAEIEIDRYATWPGQACAYKMGEIKIKELRKQAETSLGKFTYCNRNRQVYHVPGQALAHKMGEIKRK